MKMSIQCSHVRSPQFEEIDGKITRKEVELTGVERHVIVGDSTFTCFLCALCASVFKTEVGKWS